MTRIVRGILLRRVKRAADQDLVELGVETSEGFRTYVIPTWPAELDDAVEVDSGEAPGQIAGEEFITK